MDLMLFCMDLQGQLNPQYQVSYQLSFMELSVYLALLLRWKNVDMEGVRHESDS